LEETINLLIQDEILHASITTNHQFNTTVLMSATTFTKQRHSTSSTIATSSKTFTRN